VSAINEVIASERSRSEKVELIVRILTNLALQGAMFMATHGGKGGTQARPESQREVPPAAPQHVPQPQTPTHEPITPRTEQTPAASSGKTGTKPSKPRVEGPVEGLYEQLDPNHVPAGWKIEDLPPEPFVDHGNRYERLVTKVETPDGKKGMLKRSYSVETKTFVMEEAFFDKDFPWVQAGVPMVPGRGTPAVTYLTLRQMKILQARFGETQTVKMSAIVNLDSILELARLVKDAGGGADMNALVATTKSVQYATTAIEQSGQTITGVTFSPRLRQDLRQVLMKLGVGPTDVERKALADAYGLGLKDPVHWKYDIYISLTPHPGGVK
jgi:hypothetical protein